MTRMPIAPRLLTKAQAAIYCGVPVSAFDRICPIAPIALGDHNPRYRYDVRQLDKWIDGLTEPDGPSPEELLARFGEFNRSIVARAKSRRGSR